MSCYIISDEYEICPISINGHKIRTFKSYVDKYILLPDNDWPDKYDFIVSVELSKEQAENLFTRFCKKNEGLSCPYDYALHEFIEKYSKDLNARNIFISISGIHFLWEEHNNLPDKGLNMFYMICTKDEIKLIYAAKMSATMSLLHTCFTDVRKEELLTACLEHFIAGTKSVPKELMGDPGRKFEFRHCEYTIDKRNIFKYSDFKTITYGPPENKKSIKVVADISSALNTDSEFDDDFGENLYRFAIENESTSKNYPVDYLRFLKYAVKMDYSKIIIFCSNSRLFKAYLDYISPIVTIYIWGDSIGKGTDSVDEYHDKLYNMVSRGCKIVETIRRYADSDIILTAFFDSIIRHYY